MNTSLMESARDTARFMVKTLLWVGGVGIVLIPFLLSLSLYFLWGWVGVLLCLVPGGVLGWLPLALFLDDMQENGRKGTFRRLNGRLNDRALRIVPIGKAPDREV